MSPRRFFAQAVAQAGGCVPHIQPRDLENPTPCSEWNLRALLNHLLGELLWIPEILSGKTVEEVGDKFNGDLIGKNLQASWRSAVEAASQAVATVDLNKTVHLSYKDTSAEGYIYEVAGDILIHGWDVAQSIQCSMIMKPDLAVVVYEGILPHKDEFAASGLFGKPIKVADDASIQTKLLALVGRKAS